MAPMAKPRRLGAYSPTGGLQGCCAIPELATNPREFNAATLAGMATGLRTLARVLINSEAFRAPHTSSEGVEQAWAPLAMNMAEGLGAALYFLSQELESRACDAEDFPRDA